MLLVLLVICLVVVVGGLPTWGYHSYGMYPSGLGLLIVLILFVVLFAGRW